MIENEDGEYESACICEKGFEFAQESGKCIDVDECRSTGGEDLCFPNSRCVNDVGTFHCECVNGKFYRPNYALIVKFCKNVGNLVFLCKYVLN